MPWYAQKKIIHSNIFHSNIGIVLQIESTENCDKVSKSSQELDQNVITFEQRKIEDIKQIMLDLTLIQIKQHVKSMEILSATYQDIIAIDVHKDIDAFKSKFLLQPENKSLQPQMRSQSMNALTAIFPTSKGVKRQNLSNSAGSLESPKRNAAQSNGKSSPASSVDMEVVNSLSEETLASESDDDDDGNEIDETTSHDESDSDKETVQVRRRVNRIATDDDDDDEEDEYDVEPRKSKLAGKNSKAFAKNQAKQDASKKPPVPLVRLSKIQQHHAKST